MLIHCSMKYNKAFLLLAGKLWHNKKIVLYYKDINSLFVIKYDVRT